MKEKRLSGRQTYFRYSIKSRALSRAISRSRRPGRGSLETFEHGATRPHDCDAQVEPPRCIAHKVGMQPSRAHAHTRESSSLSVTAGPISRSLLLGPPCVHVHMCVYLRCTAYASCTIPRDTQCKADTRLKSSSRRLSPVCAEKGV